MNTTLLPANGVDRCDCGCKYWNEDRCYDCGDRWAAPHPTPINVYQARINHRWYLVTAMNDGRHHRLLWERPAPHAVNITVTPDPKARGGYRVTTTPANGTPGQYRLPVVAA